MLQLQLLLGCDPDWEHCKMLPFSCLLLPCCLLSLCHHLFLPKEVNNMLGQCFAKCFESQLITTFSSFTVWRTFGFHCNRFPNNISIRNLWEPLPAAFILNETTFEICIWNLCTCLKVRSYPCCFYIVNETTASAFEFCARVSKWDLTAVLFSQSCLSLCHISARLVSQMF